MLQNSSATWSDLDRMSWDDGLAAEVQAGCRLKRSVIFGCQVETQMFKVNRLFDLLVVPFWQPFLVMAPDWSLRGK